MLVVVRDRTDELRRELAEREFVSNAAHELRNPLAGISGAIEVLRRAAPRTTPRRATTSSTAWPPTPSG